MSSKTKSHKYVNLYFQVHQPRRLRRFQFFDIGSSSSYFDDLFNREIITRITENCYLPANEMLLRLIRKYPNVRITFSLSGTVIEQLRMWLPEALESFKRLAATGAVEFLGETYYHSLACFFDEDEFLSQVLAHRDAIATNFGFVPRVFRNTELIYSDEIGDAVSSIGFDGIYIDGIERILMGRSPDKLYSHPNGNTKLFTRNYRLSDDIAFRYSDQSWGEWPLTSETFLSWIQNTPQGNDLVTLGMDYETLGEHQFEAGGIIRFMESVLEKLATQKGISLINPSEALDVLAPQGVISAATPISWADHERDVSAWLGNDMQADAFQTLKKLMRDARELGNNKLIRECQYLQTSDHFYYMSTKEGSDGNVHQYFSPYSSPYEAFMNYMNVLADVEYRIKQALKKGVSLPSEAVYY
jgi:alpha-amylase